MEMPGLSNQINSLNYFEKIQKYFMENVREADDPFFFWYGATEPPPGLLSRIPWKTHR